MATIDINQLSTQIKAWAQDLGFAQASIAPIALEGAGKRLNEWLAKNHHGDMDYMQRHGSKRYRPAELLPGTVRVITVRMHYLQDHEHGIPQLKNSKHAYISRYARGRDYHKVLRKRLAQLAKRIDDAVPQHQYRAFVDSAPVMEKPLAAASGLGWQGKNTLLINQKDGSWSFLGCIYTNLNLPTDAPVKDRCGSCRACINICPTQAIVEPYVLDARRCISYLTIENKGSIPENLRSKMGNRIFGCDDCQLICPWNRYAAYSKEDDFKPRSHFDNKTLLELFSWTEEDFLLHTQGSPIRRTGYSGWLRNIAVALGNAPYDTDIVQALKLRRHHAGSMVQEHVSWAIQQQQLKSAKQAQTPSHQLTDQ
jgi:epoxyqueuosine reductase